MPSFAHPGSSENPNALSDLVCLSAYADGRYDDVCDECYDELTGGVI